MGDFAKEIQSTFKNEWTKAGLNIKFTANWLNQHSDKIFKPYGISNQQYNVLRILRGAKKPITVSDIKSRMIEKSPNTTRLMDKLCDKKLIARTRSENDRRIVYSEITGTGLNMLSEIDIIIKDFESIEKITEAEAKELNRILDKLR
ncbi:MarR family transcriptional regulator [Putridiphycobacter roseus]|uniref:MarR family transcriptional regulator n=1 Tax=Putridiphycobacter roseus TaxID=2219161 RepID=A0A2W1N5B5_9FLAO|nr:MarR family transcriptional regulator [Putridiphycobacter roseus]PZE18780.1 MarR family transcriptional regulator [Putridiphycobacter roseus]